MWNSTFFNVQILDVFSLEREKIYKNVYRKTSHRQVYLIRILPSEKNANTTHYTNPQMKKKKSLFILKLRSGFQIYYNVILTS